MQKIGKLLWGSCFVLCVFLMAFGARAEVPEKVYLFDARSYRENGSSPEKSPRVWEHFHALAALQGIVNRQAPQLYIYYCSARGTETDEFWLNWYQKDDGWLKGVEVVKLDSIEAVFDAFKGRAEGLVVYDPQVHATACLASTAAGVMDLIPVRWSQEPDSMYQILSKRYGYPVKEWLVEPDGKSKFTGKGKIPDYDLPSTGSAKTDAYRWAIERYLKGGLCDPLYAAYYIDSYWIGHPQSAGPDMHTLSNHDYFISKRSFFFDLSPWGDETPNDDREQPLGADVSMFREVLHQHYLQNGGRILKVGGFTPWPFKYTDHRSVGCKHGGVDTEWEHARIISQYNGYMEADAAGYSAMANASFHTHYPLKEKYSQPNPKPTVQQWKERGYIAEDGSVKAGLYLGHYVGDYDAPAWLYRSVPKMFSDPTRGAVPMGWAFNPNLADRAPMALVYAYRNASTNDFFITGDSGAGYLNPRSLTQRGEVPFPSGLAAWAEHCSQYMGRWDMSIVGFVLDGAGYRSTEQEFKAYSLFSPDGCGTHFEKEARMIGGVPTCNEWDLNEDPVIAARDIAWVAGRYPDKPGFAWCRSILKSPSWYLEVSEALKKNHPDAAVTVVDPYTFFGLIREANKVK